MSNMSLFESSISSSISKQLATLFLSIILSSIVLEKSAIPFFPIASSQGLVIFLCSWWLMISSAQELLTRLLSLLLYLFDNGTTSSHNSLSHLNAYFNTSFQSIMKILSCCLAQLLIYVLPIQTSSLIAYVPSWLV